MPDPRPLVAIERASGSVKRPRVGAWWERVQARESFKTAFAFRAEG
jgi:glutathione S-transferase